jgi:hypothetical protein
VSPRHLLGIESLQLLPLFLLLQGQVLMSVQHLLHVQDGLLLKEYQLELHPLVGLDIGSLTGRYPVGSQSVESRGPLFQAVSLLSVAA